MYAILLNGPPRSGKDTVSLEIQSRMDAVQFPSLLRSLSMPMRLAGFAMLGKPYSESEYEAIKDEPREIFNGGTLRQWMIAFSEQFIKRHYGSDFWGLSLLSGLPNTNLLGLLSVTDLGFFEEYAVIAEQFGADKVLVVQLEREGYSWGNDSRDYVFGHNMLRVIHPEMGTSEVVQAILSHCIYKLGWMF